MKGIKMNRRFVFVAVLSLLLFNQTKAVAQYAVVNDYRLPFISSIFPLESFYASSDLLGFYNADQSYYYPSTSTNQSGASTCTYTISFS